MRFLKRLHLQYPGALCMAVGLLGCPGKPPTDPATAVCGVFAGLVRGDAQLELGTGATEFLGRADGQRWLGNHGPQGGTHVWLAAHLHGVGPRVKLAYQMLEPDGGLIVDGERHMCLQAKNGGQDAQNITAFTPDSPSDACNRILCGGPFQMVVTVEDTNGQSVSGVKQVAGVDFGDTDGERTAPDCSAPCSGDAGH